MLTENRVLTAADWKMIFKLRCRQDGGGEFTRCLWCNADYSGAAVDCSSAATHRLDIRQLIGRNRFRLYLLQVPDCVRSYYAVRLLRCIYFHLID